MQEDETNWSLWSKIHNPHMLTHCYRMRANDGACHWNVSEITTCRGNPQELVNWGTQKNWLDDLIVIITLVFLLLSRAPVPLCLVNIPYTQLPRKINTPLQTDFTQSDAQFIPSFSTRYSFKGRLSINFSRIPTAEHKVVSTLTHFT